MDDRGNIISVDLAEFSAAAKRHVKKEWPKIVVNALASLAEKGRDDVRTLTRSGFQLHGDYVTRAILHTPNSAAQKAAAAQAMGRYGDCNASVFLRGASDPKRDMTFLAQHEWGEERNPHSPWVSFNGGRFLAVPMEDLKSKAYRTSTGKVRARYSPSVLLDQFAKSGATFNGRTTITRGQKYRGKSRRTVGTPFILATKRGTPMIAQSRNRGFTLEFVYVLKPRARIRKAWGFVDAVYSSVIGGYWGVFEKNFAALGERLR
jgi:hypothetical protein